MKAISIALASGVGLGAPSPTPTPTVVSEVHVLERAPVRRMRGDFERPDTVAMVYDAEWNGLLALVASHVDAAGATPLLIFDPEEAGDIERWKANFSPAVAARGRELVAPVDSVWIRDWGPVQSWDRSGRPVFLDAPYSDDRLADDAVPLAMAGKLRLFLESMPWGLDGGAISSDGRGLCVSTLDFFAQWELEVEDALLETLGCHTLVLVPALFGEETRHVDLEIQFAAPDRVVVAAVDPELDPVNAARLETVVDTLVEVAARRGTELEVHRVMMRPPAGGLADAYVNGIALGDRYLMPTYGDPERDAAAARALELAMPGVRVVGVDVRPLAGLGGALHCMALTFNRKRGTRSALRRG